MGAGLPYALAETLNFYNENDPKAAAWLRELITWGQIPDGVVDDRSIEDIRPSDLAGFQQCHFFAGIGGWSLALRLASWPDDRPVWTGSCPCQPFSAAGKGAGFDDERHLWPSWHWLIRQCHPDAIFGEQVATALQWWDLVSTDLEVEGYTTGAAIIGAHSVGAPHIRQRLYWMADASGARSQGWRERWDSAYQRPTWAHSLVDCRDGKRRPIEPGSFPLAHGVPGRVGLLRGYGNAIVPQVGATFIEACA